MDPEYQHARHCLESKRRWAISSLLLRIFQEQDASPDVAISADGRLEGSVKEYLNESEVRRRTDDESRAQAVLVSNARVAEWLAQTAALEDQSDSKCACVCL
jgi:predicted extracellular nuclease